MSVRIYTAGSLSDLPHQANQIRERPASNFFVSATWFEFFAAEVASRDGCAFFVYGEDAKVGQQFIIPFWKHAKPAFGGPRASSLSNFYSPFFGALTNTHAGDAFSITSEAVRESLRILEDCVCLDIAPLISDTTETQSFTLGMRSRGWHLAWYDYSVNWYLPVNYTSYQEYLAARPRQLSNTINRKHRKLERQHAVDFRVFSSPHEIASATTEFSSIYNRSWKQPEPYETFVPNLLKLCAKRGLARLGILYVDNKPAAAQFWIVYNSTASIYKLAHAPEYDSLSVGTILTSLMFQNAIEVEKVTTIDFLTGDDVYKKLWMTHNRRLIGVQAANLKTVQGALLGGRNALGKLKRKLPSGTLPQP